MIEPPVGFSSATRSLATVDLPQPDSPTMPTVSPRCSVRSTPSTACTWPTVFLKTMPWVSGKYFCSPRTSSSGSPAGTSARTLAAVMSAGSDTDDLLAVVARGLAARADEPQRRDVGHAVPTGQCLGPGAALGAPRVERASARNRGEIRWLAHDRVQP